MVCFRISDAIFEENVAPRTDEDKLRRKKSALNNFQAFVRPLIQWCVGRQDFESGTKFIFEGLQDPIINKHVSEKIFSGSKLEKISGEIVLFVYKCFCILKPYHFSSTLAFQLAFRVLDLLLAEIFPELQEKT